MQNYAITNNLTPFISMQVCLASRSPHDLNSDDVCPSELPQRMSNSLKFVHFRSLTILQAIYREEGKAAKGTIPLVHSIAADSDLTSLGMVICRT